MDKFRELAYQRPDLNQIKLEYTSLIEQFETANDYNEAKTAFFAIEKLLSSISTQRTIAYIRNTMDTTDAFYDNEIAFYNKEFPTLIPIQKKYLNALLTTPYRKQMEEEYGMQMFRSAELEQRIKSPEIMDELVEESNLCTEYKKTVATCKAVFREKECNFYGLLKHMESTDREERKEAFLTWAKLYEDIAPQLDVIYDKLIAVRVKKAKKLGFDSFTPLGYLNKYRMDYEAKDVAKFREQVLEYVVPACAKLREEQAKRIGVDKIRYYDENFIFPEGNPDPIGTSEEMVKWAQEMYRELSAETGEFFDFMVEHELYDLVTRPGKHMGGYCTSLPDFKAPFIFSNFNGTSADVDVLTHEAGHAFEGYLTSRCQEISDNRRSTSEINEIHSMSMEHFTYPWMNKFFGANADKYRFSHLCSALQVLPYMMCVDEFQHKVYENPEMSGDDRRRVWHDLEQKYMPWRDYDGVTYMEQGGFWMQKQHIFLYPFYYIDYALAQMGAFEFYGKMKKDGKYAWDDYVRLCNAGGSKGYFELLELANLNNPFKEGTVKNAIEHVLDEIHSYNRL